MSYWTTLMLTAWRVRFALGLSALSLHLAGCASEASDTSSGAADAGAHDAFAPEERFVKLTFWPLYDWNEGPTGFGPIEPLGGARVCVDRLRPLGASWDAFVRVDEADIPCVTTVVEEKVVFEKVPAASELLLVATKEGYQPSVFPVATDSWDTDPTNVKNIFTGAPFYELGFRLVRAGPPRPGIEVTIDDALGTIDARVGVGGVEAVLERRAGDGPYYGIGGVVDPSLQRFAPASIPPLVVGQVPNLVPHASFVNVPEGEYELVYAREGLACQAAGFFNGEVVFGFPSGKPNTVSVPVLDGHLTPRIGQDCTCLSLFEAGFGNVDPQTCEPLSADAGVTLPDASAGLSADAGGG
jgi:hypothetical protein